MSESTHPLKSLAPVTSFHLTHSELLPLILEQESLTRFKTFNSDTAWELGNILRSSLVERLDFYKREKGVELGGVIMIQLWTGHEVFKVVVGKGPGVSPGNWYVPLIHIALGV